MFTPYLLGGYSAALLLLYLGLRVVRSSAPDLRGARYVNRFILCIFATLLALALRPWLPPGVSLIATNAGTFASALFIYMAAADILQVKPEPHRRQLILCCAALAVLVWNAALHGSLGERLLLHCLAMAILYAMTAALLFRNGDPSLAAPRFGSAILTSAVVLLQIVWGVAGFLHPPSPDLRHIDVLEMGFSYLAMVLVSANAAALMWFSLCIHRIELHRIAQTDSLTGLLNRRAFDEILRRELLSYSRTGHALGAMLIDIDHFKQINDSLGHRAGDDALRHVAAALRETTRISDVLARHGGEEFVVLLRDATLEEAQFVAERMRQSIAALHELPGGVRLTVSIGVAISRTGESAEDFLLRCDNAMYSAKRAGRNAVIVHCAPGAEPIPAL